ncbi:hypothetical protein GCM10011404_33970 [Sphingomonas prati]|nr:hypothetical protein GCM10011404_33970 [Sphingomonas prati]
MTGATISDPTGWEAEPNRSGSRLVVKARSTGGAATMAVVTDRRSYTFTLSVAPEREKTTLPIAVRVQPATIGQLAPFQTAGNFASERTFYEIRGAAELRPSSVTEDGVRTFIDWPADAALPAVYALDTAGRESLTNGNMRNGRFVIDSVEKHLIFRLDKRAATAVRVLSRSARK